MFRASMFAASLVLFEGLALAQNPPTAPVVKVPEKDLCTVTGSVVRVGTNEPLKKAFISLGRWQGAERSEPYGARTDDAGRFSIEGIAPGRYRLFVERTGYVTQAYGEAASSGSEAILALAPGQKMQGLLFRMVPWSVISGRITDEEGEPLADVQVEVLGSVFSDGARRLFRSGRAETNDRGEYRLWDLRKGRYYLRATYRDWRRPTIRSGGAEAAPATAYAPIFYPGTADVAHAVALDVGAGQEIPGADFILIPVRAVRVRGHVFDAIQGRPATGCCGVQLSRMETFSWSDDSAPFQGPNGAYELQVVAPGTYQVTATLRSEGKPHFSHREIDVGTSDVEDVDLTVSRGVDVRGRVSVEGPKTVDLSFLRVNLSPKSQFRLGFGMQPAEIKPDGTFLIPEVSEGTYEISAGSRQEGFYLKSVRAAGQEVLESGLTVGQAAMKGALEVVLSTAGATIDGAVADNDGLPTPGATITLVPDGERRKVRRLYKRAATDQYGKFRLHDVSPGTYKVFAWREVEQAEWEDPDFLKPIEDKGVKVEAEENGHLTVQLKVISNATPANPPQ